MDLRLLCCGMLLLVICLPVIHLQWLASCSVDKSIRIWDVRSAPQKACKITIALAHDSDINVISWNKMEGFYLASGGDDGMIKVWDLRQCKVGNHFQFSMGPPLCVSEHLYNA